MVMLRACLAFAVSAGLAACASGPSVVRIANGNAPDGNAVTWPAPVTGEKARYRWIGELTGEDNIRLADGSQGGGLARAMRWIVGLDENARDRRVLQRPSAVTVDAGGRIIVADVSRQAVFVFDEARGRLDVWDQADTKTRFAAPVALALESDGKLLVSDAELKRVVRLSVDGTPINSFGQGVLQRPAGIAHDAKARMTYVADAHAHDIKVFDERGLLVDTLGARGEGRGEFNFPTHLTYVAPNLYVTDSLNARVQVINISEREHRMVGSRGVYLGNLVRPKGVAVDRGGRLYVVESFYDHVLVFNPLGQLLIGVGGTGNGAGQFFLPAGVWVDQRDRVFVADMFNGRVAVLQFLGAD